MDASVSDATLFDPKQSGNLNQGFHIKLWKWFPLNCLHHLKREVDWHCFTHRPYLRAGLLLRLPTWPPGGPWVALGRLPLSQWLKCRWFVFRFRLKVGKMLRIMNCGSANQLLYLMHSDSHSTAKNMWEIKFKTNAGSLLPPKTSELIHLSNLRTK